MEPIIKNLETQENEPEFVRGAEITDDLTEYDKKESGGIVSFGRSRVSKRGKQFDAIIYAIAENEKYYYVLKRLSGWKINYGDGSNDQWSAPNPNSSVSFLKNQSGETIGKCMPLKEEYCQSMPGWKKIGIQRPGYSSGSPAYHIIQSPDSELFLEHRPKK